METNRPLPTKEEIKPQGMTYGDYNKLSDQRRIFKRTHIYSRM